MVATTKVFVLASEDRGDVEVQGVFLYRDLAESKRSELIENDEEDGFEQEYTIIESQLEE